jgi:hypothetical protein
MSDTSKPSMREMPLLPAIICDQLWSTPDPSGVTIPIPVTTTRRKANLQKNQVEIDGCASPDWPCTAQIFSKR